MLSSTVETSAYVEQIPIVRSFMEQLQKSKLHQLFDIHRDVFFTGTAAATMHHNFTHGLVIHTAEVWQAAQAFVQAAPASEAACDRIAADDWYTMEELFNAVALHDFAKIVQYEPAHSYTWTKVRMIANQECWTLRELAKFGVELTDNELVGLLHAEGGYTEFDVEWRPLSAILHAADLWSSQAMKAVWNPAEAMSINCPRCNSPMRAINGANGLFYGCTKYMSGCRGTRDSGSTPPIEPIFLDWLKKMYPLAA